MLPTLHSVGIQRSKVKELLKFLRENLFLVLLWPAVALIIGTCSWLYLLSSMDDKAHQAEHEIFSKLTTYASNYADRSKRSLDSFDLLWRGGGRGGRGARGGGGGGGAAGRGGRAA